MKNNEKPMAIAYVTLREEFDDWAILFNPDTGRGFGLSPTGVYVWKLLDGEHTADEVLTALRRDALCIPENVHHDVGTFVDALVAEGLVGLQTTESGPLTDEQERAPYVEECSSPAGAQNGAKPFTYEPPKLVDFREERVAHGVIDCYADPTCTNGSHAGHNCYNGIAAGDFGSISCSCQPGTGAANSCWPGNGTYYCISTGTTASH